MFDPGHKQPEKLVYTSRADFDRAWSACTNLCLSNVFSLDLAEHGHGVVAPHLNGGPKVVGSDRTCTLSEQEINRGVVAEYCGAYSNPQNPDKKNVTVSLIDLEKGPIGYEALIINDLSKTDPSKFSSDIDGDGHPDSFVGVIMDGEKEGKAKYLIMVESE